MAEKRPANFSSLPTNLPIPPLMSKQLRSHTPQTPPCRPRRAHGQHTSTEKNDNTDKTDNTDTVSSSSTLWSVRTRRKGWVNEGCRVFHARSLHASTATLSIRAGSMRRR